MSKGKFKKLFKENRNARGEEAHTVRKIVFIILIVFILLFAIGGVADIHKSNPLWNQLMRIVRKKLMLRFL